VDAEYLTDHEEVLSFVAVACAAQRQLQKRFSSQAGPRWVSCNCLARDGDEGSTSPKTGARS